MYDLEPGLESDVLAAINEVPRAFFRLTAIAEKIFEGLDVTASERGVMRDLFVEGEATAPDLARRKPVTRQSIQPVLDALVAKGLACAFENPRHKRSKLYSLTPKGIDRCVDLQSRELAAIRDMVREIGDADFAAAAQALKIMNERLGERINKGR